jgi:alpha-amylase
MTFLTWAIQLLALHSLLPCLAEAAMDAEQWRNRTIYQVLTDRFAIQDGKDVKKCDPTIGIHCGGTWRGIYEHLDYIQGMNFDAIWISPIVANMPDWTSDGEGYPGYWQQSLYEINLAFGSEDDLNMLIADIHRRGMLVMLDIVVNHMAIPGPATDDLDYSIMHPFNKEEYYHPYCPNGYDDDDLENLQNCWLGGDGALLADLDTESEAVQEMLALWIRNQIWKYGIDGLRIDAAMNVPSKFFTSFMESADIFATGETYTEHVDIACEYSETIGSILNYPLYFSLTYAFEGPAGSMQNLADTIKDISAKCTNVTTLGNFAENHDVVRFANKTQDMAAAQNVVTYILSHDGIPVIYYGQEQHLDGGTEPYTNRAALWEYSYDQTSVLYKLIASLNLFRRHVSRNHPDYLATESTTIDVGTGTIAFAKGGANDPKVITVLNNQGADASDFKVELCDTKSHGYSANDELFDVVACKSNTVQGNGCIEVWVSDGEPVVLFKKSELAGSTLCGIEGSSDVDIEEVYVQSTTWTTEIGGQLTVMHTATTMPWADAPSSVTATATATTSGKGKGGSSSSGASVIDTPARYALLTVASAFLFGCFW